MNTLYSVTVADGTAAEERKNLEPFWLILEQFACTWDVHLVVHIAEGRAMPATDDGKVHVYFFSYPPDPQNPDAPGVLGYIDEIGSFTVPTDRLQKNSHRNIRGHDVGARFLRINGLMLGTHVLRSAKGIAISKTLPKNLWILFDLTFHRWEGDVVILDRILTEALPYLLPERNLARAHQQARIFAKSRHAAFINTIGSLRENFDATIRQSLASIHRKLQDEYQALIANHQKDGQALTELAQEMEITATTLQEPSRIVLTEEELGNEFDEILSWEGVRGLEMQGNMFILHTHVITKTDEQKKSGYAMAAFKAIITPPKTRENTNILTWIQITEIPEDEGGWLGPWKHPYMYNTPDQICFGGFAQFIWKCLADRRMRDLLHMVLTFLTLDHRDCIVRPESQRSTKPYRRPDTSFYATAEDRQTARRAYIRRVQSMQKELSRSWLSEKLEQAAKKEKELAAKFMDERMKLRSTGFLRDTARNQLYNPSLCEEEFRVLSTHPDLLRVDMGSDWMAASFAPPIRSDAEQNPLAYISMLARPKASLLDVSIVGDKSKFNLKSPDGNEWLPKKLYLQALRLVTCGRIASAMAAIYDYLAGKSEDALLEKTAQLLASTRRGVV